jgi:hypothetical protein
MRELRKSKLIWLILVGLNSIQSFSQTSSHGFFHSQFINGNLNLKGLYREQKSLIGEISEDQRSTYYIGGIALNTGSYLWSPDLIFINLDAEYNPESRKETYLLIPDRSEVRTLKKLDFRTSVFRNKSINLNTFLNLNQTYYNRELLTNIKSDSKQWGGLFSFNNKLVPVSISYRQSDWTQKEIQTGRHFSMSQNNLLGRITKSFGTTDKHELLYSHDDYTYNYAGSHQVNNLIDRVALNNFFYFDRNRKYSYNSQVFYHNQAGDNEFSKLEAIERLMFDLPAHLRLIGGYNYFKLKDPFQELSQNRLNGSLNHQLFESLTSDLFFDYSSINQNVYDEKNLIVGIDVNYTKKIPKGTLNLSYRYSRSYFDMKGISASVRIMNEEQTLSDGKITVLNKPYVDPGTLIIKDLTGVIIYQLNFDYTIVVRNNYLEIQRVPGGLIAENQAINADYTIIQPGSYSYESYNNSFSSSILLFKKLIELYYRGAIQNYSKLTETDFLTLNYYDQNIFGARIDIGFAGFGIEYDNYNSNIIPYKRYRYFIDLNWSFRSKLLVSVNGNIMDYKIIDDDVNQQHSNISGKITYSFTHKTRLDIEAGYLSQNGRNIDLEMLNSKIQISTSFRQLFVSSGFESYTKNYRNSNFAFTGLFIQIIRKF